MRRRSFTEQPLLDGEGNPSVVAAEIINAEVAEAAQVRRWWDFQTIAPTRRDKLSLSLIFTGISLFLPIVWALVLTDNPSSKPYFTPHAPLNALAISCFVLGIVPVQPPTPGAALRSERLSAHQVWLLGIAIPAMLVGTGFMWYNKEYNGAEHYTTWHAWFGLATLTWALVQAAVGAGSAWAGGWVFGGGARARAVYKYHRISGYILLFLSMFTAFLAGMFATWSQLRGWRVQRVLAFVVGLGLIAVGVVMRIRPNKMRLT